MQKILASAAALLPVLSGCAAPHTPRDSATRPNILLIVADDLGYTDLGIFGSEINTPNLDRLARSGMLLTNFLVAPACSPTRAMLMTGKDPHRVGLGTMSGEQDERQSGAPGYEGVMTSDDTIARRLQAAGYFTCMAGKWHLGTAPEVTPHARGFERSFALLPGGASHFADAFKLVEAPGKAPYLEDGRPVELPDDFYSSDAYTDKLIGYFAEARHTGKPVFAYAAYTAPHWPLHAPREWLAKVGGRYDDGYDALRSRRLQGAIAAGVTSPAHPTPPRYPLAPAWSSLSPEEQRRESRSMEIYAAMVENLDHNVGRLLAALRAAGELERTLIVFCSDNGPEGNPVGNLAGIGEYVKRRFDNRLENLGHPGSYCWLSPGWARAAVAPFRLFKAFPTQGGVRVPAIVSWPGTVEPGRSDAAVTARDFWPMAIHLASGRDAPRSHMMLTPTPEPEHVVGWELFGRRAIQKGRFKIAWIWPPYGSGRWELYDLEADPAESRDLAAEQPAKLRELLAHWHDYARENQVVLPARDTGYALER
ncbi:MAG: arylsulfatase [bacterium]|nr:arylsulfatase [bacterium]